MFKQGFSDLNKTDIKLTRNFLGIDLKFPMLAPTNPDLQHFMLHREIARYGGLGVIHLDNIENLSMYQVEGKPTPVLVVGTDIVEIPAIKRAVEAGIKMILIEKIKPSMAMVHQLAAIKSQHPEVKVIVGNFENEDSLGVFLEKCSSMSVLPDAIKVGLYSGTKDPIQELGFESKLEDNLPNIINRLGDLPIQIIAEGNIIDAKDAVKILYLGAHLIVMEELCAGAEETAKETKMSMIGPIIRYNHKFFKTYQNTVPAIGPIRDELRHLEDEMKEIISLTGKNL
jgi:hypothetical protein